jgi:hypothetical protein
LLAAVVMLIGARKWRVQGLGLLAFLFGVGDFFVRLIGQWGPQPVGERERDLVQALLDVGGVGLFLGLLIWFTFRIIGRGATDAPSDDINGGRHPSVVYDRRKNVFDRRRRPPPPKPPS